MQRKLSVTIAALTLVLGLLGLRLHAGSATPYKIGDKVKNFTLKDERGQKVSLSRFANKIVVLAFYGSW